MDAADLDRLAVKETRSAPRESSEDDRVRERLIFDPNDRVNPADSSSSVDVATATATRTSSLTATQSVRLDILYDD